MQVKGFKDTIAWYDQNAEQYAKATSRVDLEQLTEFTKLLPAGGRVLDAERFIVFDSALANHPLMKV